MSPAKYPAAGRISIRTRPGLLPFGCGPPGPGTDSDVRARPARRPAQEASARASARTKPAPAWPGPAIAAWKTKFPCGTSRVISNLSTRRIGPRYVGTERGPCVYTAVFVLHKMAQKRRFGRTNDGKDIEPRSRSNGYFDGVEANICETYGTRDAALRRDLEARILIQNKPRVC